MRTCTTGLRPILELRAGVGQLICAFSGFRCVRAEAIAFFHQAIDLCVDLLHLDGDHDL